MKLREEEFYEQYHQHGGTTIIPTEIFNELYDDATEEIERLKEELKYTVPIVEHNKTITKHLKEIERLHSIIKEVRELRNKISNLYYEEGFELDTPMLLKYIDEILDKVDKEE